MTNKEIAVYFNDLANIMELHKENPFKIKSYRNTYIQLRKLDTLLTEMSEEEISAMKGIGKATTAKIQEIIETKELQTYQKYKEKTPDGIIEMLQIKGFGPGKIRTIWRDLEVESVGELLYACNENRLVKLKGFGAKTQQDLIERINYYNQSKHKFLYARIEQKADRVFNHIQNVFTGIPMSFVGEYRRKCPIVERVDMLIATQDIDAVFNEQLVKKASTDVYTDALTDENLPLRIYTCSPEEYGSKLFRYSSNRAFIDGFLEKAKAKDFKDITDEKEVFTKAGLVYVVPELRENANFITRDNSQLIEEKDIKGVIHSHSTYSDGINSLQEMADYAKEQGFKYLGITDHSKTAFYANGLKEDRILEQWNEIDTLNASYSDFKIYKGIESDILYDGKLDYEEDILKGFDFIIASVHSQLKMDEAKATSRLISAIENPYTTILGHPTGRLLLSRKGYPIDYKKVIDACSANGVSIEMNANPLRLDLDYEWIPYAMEKGVKISINPDAHSTQGIHDIKYGVMAARKGGLTREFLFGLE